MAIVIDERDLPLEEFVKLPTTVDFNLINTDRFKLYAKDKPYIKVGTQLANKVVMVYANEKYIPKLFNDLGNDFFDFYPYILSPLDSNSNEESGISPIINQSYLNLSGRGVVIGFVDTGIDYTKDAFKFEDGSTKILSIWDQTIDGPKSDGVYFGSVYADEQINEALKSDNPLNIVPSTDTDGHGTFLASVAASNEKGEYIGSAPKSNLVCVKLRRARQYYIDKYLLPQGNPNLYESTDYLLGLKFIADVSEKYNMPVVFCISMGTNMSGHDGNSFLEDYISFGSLRAGYASVSAAGNESNTKHHTQGKIARTGMNETINFNVGKPDSSFIITLSGPAYDKISVSIASPAGEVIARIPFRLGLEYSEKLVLEKTVISVRYFKTSNNTIFIGFQNASEGIWEIKIFGDSIITGEYFAWLPITGQISESIDFLKPVSEYTIVYPATSLKSITCGAYNTFDNSLYISSSWGPTRVPRMAPDFVAPGVNIKGIYPSGYGTMSGTCVAAAITAGAAAILLEWGIVKGNIPSIDVDLIRTLLISGCTRDEDMLYPNVKWGYGKLNLSGTFAAIRESIINYNLS